MYSKERNEFQFMCGKDDHSIDNVDPIHVDHVFEDDPSLVPLAFIRTSFVAQRLAEANHWTIEFVSEEYLDQEV